MASRASRLIPTHLPLPRISASSSSSRIRPLSSTAAAPSPNASSPSPSPSPSPNSTTTAIDRQNERSSSSTGVLTGSDKLLQDALRLEAEEEAALTKQARTQDPNDPIWTGEERVQDTVLRMVMDKYKPLRIRLAEDGKDPADEKIKAGIQVPSTPGAPPSSNNAGAGAEIDLSGPTGTGQHEDGRKLPKTPDQKPWRAVYVRPAHLFGSAAGQDEDTPSIYYGQFLKSSSSSPHTVVGKTASSELRNKLKAAGINVSALPVDDPKAMTQLRQGIKTAERRGKLLRARDSVLDYQLSKPSSSSSSTSSTIAAAAEEGEEKEVKGDQVSDVNRNLQLQLGHAQGWDSVIEKRIKAALDSGLFKENKLRGKPLMRDMEEKNPFLAREEYFMNRIVKRQGAAPPWVELNMELETELSSWRSRFTDNWIRRASRMITTSPGLSDGLEPLSFRPPPPQPATATATAAATAAAAECGTSEAVQSSHAQESGTNSSSEIPIARTAGERKLVDVATRYRDSEWEQREHSYHSHELKRLNDLIRKHNHLAPFTARKGLMILDVELASLYTRALPKLVREISTILDQKIHGGAASSTGKHGWHDALNEQDDNGLVSYDMWGREIKSKRSGGDGQTDAGKPKGWMDGWLGNAVGSSPGGAGAGRRVDVEQKDAREQSQDKVLNFGLIEAFQKSIQWAKDRIRP